MAFGRGRSAREGPAGPSRVARWRFALPHGAWRFGARRIRCAPDAGRARSSGREQAVRRRPRRGVAVWP